jgi:hypothetical protein
MAVYLALQVASYLGSNVPRLRSLPEPTFPQLISDERVDEFSPRPAVRLSSFLPDVADRTQHQSPNK